MMSSRKEEILLKRQKLDALKRQREARQLQFSTSRNQDTSETASPSNARVGRMEDRRSEVDTLVESLIRDSRPSSTIRSRPNSVITESSVSELASPQTETSQHTAISYQTLSTFVPTVVYDAPPSPVREVITYSKEVQTIEPWVPTSTSTSTDDIPVPSTPRSPVSRRGGGDEELRNRIQQLEEEIKELQLKEAAEETKGVVKEEVKIIDMSEDERTKVMSSEEFADFIERSSKVVERALDQKYDILTDYGLGMNGGEDEHSGRRVKETAQFYSERWSKKRIISDLHFSPSYPELILASYTKNPSAPHDPDGLVQVWNMHLHDRPEYIFHAQSDVLTARFSPFHWNLIVGGAYSGQVLLWDTRAKSAPVLKTPLTGSGHTHPVYSVNVVGTQNANNILSCSSDGVVCGWTVDMLAQPQELLELTTPPPSKSEDLAPTSMAFPYSDPTYFLVGTEEGTIYPCHRYDRAGAKAGVEPRVSYKGHAAPVMSIDFHPVRGPVDLGDLVLSSSLDWSVKLWKARPPAATSTTVVPGAAPQIGAPIMEFSREDMVYDAKWSPVKPGVFGLVDGSGSLEIWDITVDTEVPLAKAQPSQRPGASSLLAKSLNKMSWEHIDGRRVAVGGLDAAVTIFDVGSELGGVDNARQDEWTSMKKLVAAKSEGGSSSGGLSSMNSIGLSSPLRSSMTNSS